VLNLNRGAGPGVTINPPIDKNPVERLEARQRAQTVTTPRCAPVRDTVTRGEGLAGPCPQRHERS
jgi:hypothetical protein